eukprot:1895020-Amphidinium_carterae.1
MLQDVVTAAVAKSTAQPEVAETQSVAPLAGLESTPPAKPQGDDNDDNDNEGNATAVASKVGSSKPSRRAPVKTGRQGWQEGRRRQGKRQKRRNKTHSAQS